MTHAAINMAPMDIATHRRWLQQNSSSSLSCWETNADPVTTLVDSKSLSRDKKQTFLGICKGERSNQVLNEKKLNGIHALIKKLACLIFSCEQLADSALYREPRIRL